MARPHVAGAVVLLYSLGSSIGPSMTHIQVETILKDTARAFSGTCTDSGADIVTPMRFSALYGPWIAGWLGPVLSVLN